jgi:uncharacterized protein YndB with AHSA1/START domain
MNLSSAIVPAPSPTLRAASVRLSRQVSAAPGRIFDAWLNADEARWFLFGDRIGSLEIQRPYRLVFSLFVDKYAQRDDRVIVELAPVAARSLLVLTHELSLPNPAQRSRIQRGWALVLDRLGALCTAGPIPPALAPAPDGRTPDHESRPVRWLSPVHGRLRAR